VKPPAQCHLWQKEILDSKDLREAFQLVESYIDESHLHKTLMQCKTCGQLYFYEFYEEIDWDDGRDLQYQTYIPVDTEEEIVALKTASLLELFAFSPRLQSDWLAPGALEVRWVGKEP
jgi:hypothetical protein